MKDKIWGGKKLKTLLDKDVNGYKYCGESWEISTVANNVSIVANGALRGRSLSALIETYQEQLVGKSVYQQFGNQFPLLIKFIDATDDLSIQVHPDDSIAQAKHHSFGKTEMWFVIDAEKEATLISGFEKPMDKATLKNQIDQGIIMDSLAQHNAQKGDVFYIPAGRVHAIGAGILLTEIQQTSDITYRLYDYNRIDTNGQKRELHIEDSLEAINYSVEDHYKTKYTTKLNDTSKLVTSPYFTTKLIYLGNRIYKDYKDLDSFVIYICVEGSAELKIENNESLAIKFGETLLLPASIKNIVLKGNAKLLEVHL